MSGQDMLDCVGVPEYFATHVGVLEDAGNGLLRIVRCIERNGVLIPVFSSVLPALSILQGWAQLNEIARRVACGCHGDGRAN